MSGEVELVVSELVTNGVLHAADSEVLQLSLENQTDGVRIVLSDASSIAPVVRDLSGPAGSVDGRPYATSGRGMALVQALATRWGVDPDDRGKQVWVELGDAAATFPATLASE